MLASLRRGMPRILALVLVGVLNLLVSYLPELTGLKGGPLPILCPLAYSAGLGFLLLGAGDTALRILQPRVDPQHLAKTADLTGSASAAIAYLGHNLLRAAVLVIMASSLHIGDARGAEPPAAAVPLLPVLKAQQLAYWSNMPLASALGAQVEQETGPCPGRSCWNPRAQLRTSREQGVGLGQLTRTWDARGRPRFDTLTELARKYPTELAGLSWDNHDDPLLQLRALVLMDRDVYRRVHDTATSLDRLAMTFSAYNGGAGGLASDRRACAATDGCDPGRWFGNVEHTSLKAKAALPGYGQSFFQTNRTYVRNTMLVRRVRYLVLDT